MVFVFIFALVGIVHSSDGPINLDFIRLHGTAERDDCDEPATMLKLKVRKVIKLYEGPDEKSKSLGEIEILNCHGKRFDQSRGMDVWHNHYEWIRSDGKRFPFYPVCQIFNNDHSEFDLFTILDTKDGWVKFPRNPFDGPVWLKQNMPFLFETGVNSPSIKLSRDIVVLNLKTKLKEILFRETKLFLSGIKDGILSLSIDKDYIYEDDDQIPYDLPAIQAIYKEYVAHEEKRNNGQLKPERLKKLLEFAKVAYIRQENEIMTELAKTIQYTIPITDFLDEDLHAWIEFTSNRG